jgi:hypothetical protein
LRANIKSPTRSRQHRSGMHLLEPGLPANQALRSIRQTASSFFAGKPRSYSTCGNGFSREGASASDAFLALATQPSRLKPVPREFGDEERLRANIESPTRSRQLRSGMHLLEPGLPANQALRSVRQTASSFFAGKPRSNRAGISDSP